ncbi:hypothetical protein KAX02_08660 [candidate division WOR-3 bacterium]|nr:hypothetical protein [candidate division WOR-3 bacterium]
MAKKFGYKPSGHSLSGMSPQTLYEMHIAPKIRIFSKAFGRGRGMPLWAAGVPWAGVTEGAKSTSDAIDRIKAVNPGVAKRCEAFARGASHEKGVVEVVYTDTGEVSVIPAAAAARIGPDSPITVRGAPKVYA